MTVSRVNDVRIVVIFGHPLRASHASPSLREGELCITTVIPAKAGIQRGRATERRM